MHTGSSSGYRKTGRVANSQAASTGSRGKAWPEGNQNQNQEPKETAERETNYKLRSSLLVVGVILGSQRLEVEVAAAARGAAGGAVICPTSCRRSRAPCRLHALKLVERKSSSCRLAKFCSSSWKESSSSSRVVIDRRATVSVTERLSSRLTR